MLEIITISTLAILLIGMFIYHIVLIKEYNSQIRELNKILKAKTLTEYAVSDKVEEEVVEQKPPEYIPAEDIDDSIFQKMIERQLDGSR